MTAVASRMKVRAVFKQIHRTSQFVFNEDLAALSVVRGKINEEFKKHVEVKEPEKVNELIGVAVEAEETLRKNVIQAKLDENTGNFRLKIHKETYMYDNTIFDPNAELPKGGRRRRKCDDPPTS